MKYLSLLAAPLVMVSCVGYQLGGVQPKSLERIETIAVPMFRNQTQHPRAETLATSAVASAITQDGTYRVTSVATADAVLEGTLESIEYTPIRSNRFDTMLPEELANTVKLEWVLKDARDPTKLLASGQSIGISKAYVDANLQTARNNALPDALERAAEALVSRLADGY
jgi:hypothetical protein